MKFAYDNPRLRKSIWESDADWDYLYERARACLVFRMTPEYFDDMTQLEYAAWKAAYKDIYKDEEV